MTTSSAGTDPEKTVEGLGANALLDDRFELDGIVASGAVGVVYRGRDRHTGEACAVKVLRGAEPEDVERFSREAQALSRLRDDAIVRLIAHGVSAARKPYLAMAWLDGETLAARLQRGALSVAETLTLGRRIAGALAAAHEAGALHRDVKPANIVLVAGALDRATLVDFGLVRQREDPVRTCAGTLLGTPAYMAPEQVRGELDVDARADVFALGAVLYECLSGARAFVGEGVVDVLSAVLLEEPRPLRACAPDAPVALARLIERMLSKDKTPRPASGAEVRAALDEIVSNGSRCSTTVERRYEATRARRFDAPASLVWAILADTDRWDRFCKAPRTQYVERDDPTAEDLRVRVGIAEIAAQPSRWLEVGEGVEGRHLRAARRFIEGWFSEIGLDVDLAAVDGHVRCEARCTVYVVDDGRAPDGAAALLLAHMTERLERYLDAIEQVLSTAPAALLERSRGESATAHARRLLLGCAWSDPVMAGRATVADAALLEARIERFRAPIDGVDPALQRKLAAFVERGADDLVRRVRPGELASAWAFDERSVLRAMLAATKLGLFELRWELRCRNCRTAAASATSLSAVTSAVHCAECAIDTTVDLAQNVEAVFAVSSALRRTSAKMYCGASPAHRPHVAAFFTVAAGAIVRVSLALAEGAMLVRAVRRAQSSRIAYERPPRVLRLTLGTNGWHVERVGEADEGALTELWVENETPASADVQLEYTEDGASSNAVRVAAMPEFARWFADEAPGRGAELSMSAAAVLVVECLELDALCEREGDVAAFAQIERALTAITAAIEEGAEGAVLRRTGGALTALFVDGSSAERAFERAAVTARSQGVALGGARYEGSCVMVRRDERTELFGRGVVRARASAARARDGTCVVIPGSSSR